MSNSYDDILHLPHPEPKKRKRMSMIDRAVQSLCGLIMNL